MLQTKELLRDALIALYGEACGERTYSDCLNQLKDPLPTPGDKEFGVSSKDAVLTVYADSFLTPRQPSLRSLREFWTEHRLDSLFNRLHILPFCTWDTDRGFSVINYSEVDPRYGDWDDVQALAKEVDLMFDLVVNHCSVENPYVQGALLSRHFEQNELPENLRGFQDFVLAYAADALPAAADLKAAFSPRAFPLLTPYYVTEEDGRLRANLGEPQKMDRVLGSGFVWTTYSRGKDPDGIELTKQVDLNYANPAVFIEAVRVLKFYVLQGARSLRLDAIGRAWKELGTNCSYLPETHSLLAALKAALTLVGNSVSTVAEVKASPEIMLSYLGSAERPESDFVFQFAHYPLAVYALHTGDLSHYARWLRECDRFRGRQFVTVCGTHDGLEMKNTWDILSSAEREELEKILIERQGGLPNYAQLPGGGTRIYEICGTPWDMLNNGFEEFDLSLALRRFGALLTLGFCVRGVPVIYYTALVGSKNYSVPAIEENRTVNRETFDLQHLHRALRDENSRTTKVFRRLQDLLTLRSSREEFSPYGSTPDIVLQNEQKVLFVSLSDRDGKKRLDVYVNASAHEQELERTLSSSDFLAQDGAEINAAGHLVLAPFGYCWLTHGSFGSSS